jgi:thiamine-phosphate pyrophosphorylase
LWHVFDPSIESLDELSAANQLTCIDYVAASAVFQSSTKPDCSTIWGLDGLRRICAHSIHPVIAIGGILLENIQAVIQAGAQGIAVVSAIHHARCPKLAAAQMMSCIESVYD